jgi:Mrp family chromosome partitioning ATPase
MDKEDVERNSKLPLAGIVKHFREENPEYFVPLIKSLGLKNKLVPKQIITVSSIMSNEGKTMVSQNISKVLIDMGYSACLIDYDSYNFQLSENNQHFDLLNTDFKTLTNGAVISVKNSATVLNKNQQLLAQKMQELLIYFDFVIVDTPAAGMGIEAVEMMKKSTLNIFVLRTNHTSLSHVGNIDLIAEEYGLKNIQLVLTDAHRASNYNGNLIGTRFNYNEKEKGILNRLKRYINYYF